MKNLFLIFAVLLFISAFFSCVNDSGTESGGYEWTVSTPEDLGLDSEGINNAFREAESKAIINAVVIIRHGKIAAEKYFNGKDRNSYQTVRSVSKSFLSALYGIAIDKGILQTGQKLADFFPEFKSSINDARINNITIDQLMKMRAGFKGDEEFYFTFTNSSDWVKTILSSTLNFDPGSKMGYSTAGTHLLAVILARAAGMNLRDFAQKNLFDQTKIEIKNWLEDPQGNCFGGNDMYFTPRDMAALGLIYMNGGMINGKQVVPPDWVNKSTVSYSGQSSNTWGKLSKYGYGLLWWTGEIGGQKIFMALGHGGQFIMCFPSLDMIIAVQSYPDSDWNTADAQERSVLDVIADYVIPAVKGS